MNIDINIQIKKIIHDSSKIISKDAIKEIKHFYEHGEYEMALEGLIIELMKSNVVPDNYNYTEWCELIQSIGLDEEPNFYGDFWVKFTEWGKGKDL